MIPEIANFGKVTQADDGRFGINTFLFASPFTTDTAALWFPRFRQWGFASVELAVESPGDIDSWLVKELLEENSLACGSFCGAFGPGRDLRGTDAEQQASRDYIRSMFSLMEKLDCRMFCGPLYSRVGRASAFTREERAAQWNLVKAHLRALAQEACDRGLIIALEPLNRFETDFINTCAQALRMVEEVASPALKIHLDTFHMNIEEKDPAAAIRLAGPHLAHFHACACDRGTPGSDHIDWKSLSTALQEVGYRGDWVIESFTPEVEVIARAAAIWRDIEPDRCLLARDGLKFLRSLREDQG